MALRCGIFGITLVVMLTTTLVSGQVAFTNPSYTFGFPSSTTNFHSTLPQASNIGANAYNPSTDGSNLYGSTSGYPVGSSTLGFQNGVNSPPGGATAHAASGGFNGAASGSGTSSSSTGSSASGSSSASSTHVSPEVRSRPSTSGHSSASAHASAVSSRPPSNSLGHFRIVCLFNNMNFYKGGFSPSMIDPSLCTHINYEFAILDPMTYEMITGEPDLDIQQNFYQEVIDLKRKNPQLKVLLSLGGWDDSTKKYSEMADDPSKRKNFILKAVSFLKAHSFDGMDLAWEYPNCWQGAIGVNTKDKDNFSSLLKELRSAFTASGLELSVSVGAIKREIEAAYDVPIVSAAVDHINVMTYDMHGPWEAKTGHHTQFEQRPDDSDPDCNVKSAMQIWVNMGADKKKLNMGLAYYGKTFTLADPANNGMGAASTGIGNAGPVSKNGGFLLYNEMCQFLNAGNWTEKEQKHVGFYSYSDDQWACYDPPMMVVRKAKYVVEAGLGGVLLKDLSGDDYKGKCFSMSFPLTKMVRLEMISKIRRRHRQRG